MARVVRDRVRPPRPPIAAGRCTRCRSPGRRCWPRRPASPEPLLLGAYAGLLAWVLPRRDTLVVADRDALVAGLSAIAALGLVVAALLLERACRTPDERG